MSDLPLPTERRRPPIRMATVSAGIPFPLVQKIDDLAFEHGTNRSRLISMAVVLGLPQAVEKILADKTAKAAAAAQQQSQS